MTSQKRKLLAGTGLMAGFVVVLVIIFLPLYHGQNGLNYLDSLYNSISKASAYYIPSLREETGAFQGQEVSVVLSLESEDQSEKTRALFSKAGAAADSSGATLRVQGDLGGILANCLADADNMFENRGQEVADKYGYPEREVLFNWWTALKAMDKALSKQKNFERAGIVSKVNKKAVECSYNYYGIEPQKIIDRWGVVLASLLFYVLYTVWYGVAILYLFEGYGLGLNH